MQKSPDVFRLRLQRLQVSDAYVIAVSHGDAVKHFHTTDGGDSITFPDTPYCVEWHTVGSVAVHAEVTETLPRGYGDYIPWATPASRQWVEHDYKRTQSFVTGFERMRRLMASGDMMDTLKQWFSSKRTAKAWQSRRHAATSRAGSA